MKLKIHYQWPLRDKMVSTHHSIPYLTSKEVNKYLDETWKTIENYRNLIGFKFEFSVEES